MFCPQMKLLCRQLFVLSNCIRLNCVLSQFIYFWRKLLHCGKRLGESLYTNQKYKLCHQTKLKLNLCSKFICSGQRIRFRIKHKAGILTIKFTVEWSKRWTTAAIEQSILNHKYCNQTKNIAKSGSNHLGNELHTKNLLGPFHDKSPQAFNHYISDFDKNWCMGLSYSQNPLVKILDFYD